jgi:hypothetical protein
MGLENDASSEDKITFLVIDDTNYPSPPLKWKVELTTTSNLVDLRRKIAETTKYKEDAFNFREKRIKPDTSFQEQGMKKSAMITITRKPGTIVIFLCFNLQDADFGDRKVTIGHPKKEEPTNDNFTPFYVPPSRSFQFMAQNEPMEHKFQRTVNPIFVGARGNSNLVVKNFRSNGGSC